MNPENVQKDTLELVQYIDSDPDVYKEVLEYVETRVFRSHAGTYGGPFYDKSAALRDLARDLEEYINWLVQSSVDVWCLVSVDLVNWTVIAEDRWQEYEENYNGPEGV